MSLDAFELRSLLARLVPARLRRGEYALPPLVGYLDRPFFRGDGLVVCGWLLARGTPVQGVTLIAGGREVPLVYHVPRPDVASMLGEPWAESTGFEGVVPLAHD